MTPMVMQGLLILYIRKIRVMVLMVKLGLQQVLGLFGYEKIIYQQSDLSIQ